MTKENEKNVFRSGPSKLKFDQKNSEFTSVDRSEPLFHNLSTSNIEYDFLTVCVCVCEFDFIFRNGNRPTVLIGPLRDYWILRNVKSEWQKINKNFKIKLKYYSPRSLVRQCDVAIHESFIVEI